MIHISPSAKTEIQKVLNSYPKSAEMYLRLGIKGDSCNGSLVLGLDKKKEGDEIHTFDEIPFLIARKHYMYIIGTHITFNNTGGKGSFVAKIP